MILALIYNVCYREIWFNLGCYCSDVYCSFRYYYFIIKLQHFVCTQKQEYRYLLCLKKKQNLLVIK